MPNFKKQERELSNHLEYWLYYLNHVANSHTIPETLANDKLLTEAFNVAEFLGLSKDEQFAYQHDLKKRLDYQNVMSYAREEAEKKGVVMGIAKGIEQGKLEGKIEMAKKLLNKVDIETIALTSGLSIEVIQKLKDEQ